MKIIKTKNGYFYKIYKNNKKRISLEEYLRLKNNKNLKKSSKFNYLVGDNINYIDKNKNIIQATITAINFNVSYGEEPDITIRFKNGNERQTILSRICK